MDDAKLQLVDKLKTANNILVTVSRNPSVDQLAGCIGLTLLLNKQGKHAAAVFSGKVPSTLEFLKPDDTLEKNTDSLRDFIISLDKSKADKLRYKVEEDVVRIFITPYKTSISQDDLEFSDGDFNVDVVVALGVQKQEDLDGAITVHGRILHDATVASINTSSEGGLGTINWHDTQASSLSELVSDLSQALEGNLLDEQIATALLTGVVAATDRFSNEKTSPRTMSTSAALMSAGANQQLVVSKLESEMKVDKSIDGKKADHDEPTEDKDGELAINHPEKEKKHPKKPIPHKDAPEPLSLDKQIDDLHLDELEKIDLEPPKPAAGPSLIPAPEADKGPSTLSQGSKLVTEPPKLGGELTANSQSEHLDPVTDPLSLPNTDQPALLDHKVEPASSTDTPQMTPPPPAWTPPAPFEPPTPAAEPSPAPAPEEPVPLESARDKVDAALNSAPPNDLSEEPIEALNAQPLGDNLHPASGQPAPPPVPPPIPFQFNAPNPPQQDQK